MKNKYIIFLFYLILSTAMLDIFHAIKMTLLMSLYVTFNHKPALFYYFRKDNKIKTVRFC